MLSKKGISILQFLYYTHEADWIRRVGVAVALAGTAAAAPEGTAAATHLRTLQQTVPPKVGGTSTWDIHAYLSADTTGRATLATSSTVILLVSITSASYPSATAPTISSSALRRNDQ